MQEMQKTRVPSLGQKDPLKEETATSSSILAWEIPQKEEPGGPQSLGLQSQIPPKQLSTQSGTHYVGDQCILLWLRRTGKLFWDFRMKDTLIVLLIIFSISNISDSMIMTSTTCVIDFNGIKCNLASATHKALWWAHQGLQRWVKWSLP